MQGWVYLKVFCVINVFYNFKFLITFPHYLFEGYGIGFGTDHATHSGTNIINSSLIALLTQHVKIGLQDRRILTDSS